MQRTALGQVFPSDADQREVSDVLAKVHSVVTVLQLRYMKRQTMLDSFLFHVLQESYLVCVQPPHLLHIAPQELIRWVVDSFPVDFHVNLLIELQDHQTVTKVTVEKVRVLKLSFRQPCRLRLDNNL